MGRVNMLATRVMPCLLIRNGALVKTIRFKHTSYVGDPVNSVRIFNEKEVDELVILDITATPDRKGPPFALIEEIAGECFMPLSYGGGIENVGDAQTLFSLGVEKVILNSAAVANPSLISQLADRFGIQSIVVSIDAKKKFFGRYEVLIQGGRKKTGLSPVEHAARVTQLGAGELLLTSIDNDGVMQGYDLTLLDAVASAVDVPVIACGGAGRLEDFNQAVNSAGASAVAAGSMVVYQGPNRAVLINFPTSQELESVLPTRRSA